MSEFIINLAYFDLNVRESPVKRFQGSTESILRLEILYFLVCLKGNNLLVTKSLLFSSTNVCFDNLPLRTCEYGMIIKNNNIMRGTRNPRFKVPFNSITKKATEVNRKPQTNINGNPIFKITHLNVG
jgi:hypothetical protein